MEPSIRASNSRIHVVQVLEATAGGTRKHVLDVLAALPRAEFENELVCAVSRDESFSREVERLRDRGVRVHILPMRRRISPLSDWICARRMRDVLARCDIVHLHSAKAGWIGRLASRGLDCRVIYTPHCFPQEQDVSWPFRLLYRWAERLSIPETDLLVAVSQREALLAERIGFDPRKQIRILENALDSESWRQQVGRRRRRLEGAPRTFGLVGELRRQKGPETFLKAAALAHQECPGSLRFSVPARGPYLDWARRFVKRQGLEGALEFVDHTSASLRRHYRRIDVAVLPSRWEGLPYALLESFALGLPVIGSAIPPLERFLRPLSVELLFPVGDWRALGKRMLQWSVAPEEITTRIGRLGQEVVYRYHDQRLWESALRRMYRSLAGREPIASASPTFQVQQMPESL